MSTITAPRLPRLGLAAKLLFLAGTFLTLWLLGAMLHSSRASASPAVPSGAATSHSAASGSAATSRGGHVDLMGTVRDTLRHAAAEPATRATVEKVVRPVVRPVVHEVVRPIVHDVVRPVVDDVVRPIVHKVVDQVVRPVVHKVVDQVRPVVREVTAPTIGAGAAHGDTAAGLASGPSKAELPSAAHAAPTAAAVTTDSALRSSAHPAVHDTHGAKSAVVRDQSAGGHAPVAPTAPPAPIGGYTPSAARAFGPDLPILSIQAPTPGGGDCTHGITAERSNDLLGTLLRRPGFSPD